MRNTFFMELNDFPRTRPDTLATVRAALVDNANLRLHQLNGILRTNPNATAAKVAFAGNNMNHQWGISWHKVLAVDSG